MTKEVDSGMLHNRLDSAVWTLPQLATSQHATEVEAILHSRNRQGEIVQVSL